MIQNIYYDKINDIIMLMIEYFYEEHGAGQNNVHMRD